MGRKMRGLEKIVDRRFQEMFGCNLKVAPKIWTLVISQPMVHGTLLMHMVWALLFMKVYAKETTLCSLAGGVNKKT
jgi:hypothetical protein